MSRSFLGRAYWSMPVCMVAFLVILPASTYANDDPTAAAGTDTFNAGASENTDGATPSNGSEATPSGDDDSASPVLYETPVCDFQSLTSCRDAQLCPDGTPRVRQMWIMPDGTVVGDQEVCPDEAEPDRDPTPDEVAAEFKKVGLPSSTIVVQPPDGETLVNLETVFSTSAEPFDAPLTILGHQVVLHITPSKFAWHHGDGTSQTTTSPGAAWTEGADAEQLIHHVYTAKATDLGVSVDTTWSATWTLDGRDMGAVPGVVVKTGGASTLDVLEARPVLTR